MLSNWIYGCNCTIQVHVSECRYPTCPGNEQVFPKINLCLRTFFESGPDFWEHCRWWVLLIRAYWSKYDEFWYCIFVKASYQVIIWSGGWWKMWSQPCVIEEKNFLAFNTVVGAFCSSYHGGMKWVCNAFLWLMITMSLPLYSHMVDLYVQTLKTQASSCSIWVC